MSRPLLFALLLLTLHGLRAEEVNLAFGRPIIGSAASIGGYPITNINDGDTATFSHPATPTIGFYYQIDLGQEYSLQGIHLYSRVDCCGDARLSRVRMTVHADAGGAAGSVNWSYDVRPNGENNVQGSVDILTPNLHPAGQMRGRFIRITNYNNTSYAPQVAEIEVYEAPKPTLRFFGPDVGNITKTGAPGKPTQANLFWKVTGATSVSINQGIGVVSNTAGSVTVSPAVTTTYTLTATNGSGVAIKTVTIGVDEVETPPILSEFLASNIGGLRDNFGKRSDWIEISNPNPFTINLEGYYLTDNAGDKMKWRFPAFTVPGNGYALVYADSATSPGEPYDPPHANFSLAAGGEYIGLVAPNGTTVLSQFPASYPDLATFPAQEADFSYGFSGGVEGFFAVPTPEAPNGTRFDGVVAAPVPSLTRGFFASAQSVTITCATPGAQIRYTLDGSVPTATTGSVYSGSAISISATTILRVAAFRAGWVPAKVVTNTYLFPASVIATTPWVAPGQLADATTMNEALKQVPSMSLTVGPGVTINGAEDKVGALEWIDPTGGTGFQIPCGVKNFGGAFTNFAKKSYRITFKGAYGASKLEFPLFAGFERGLAPAEEFDQIELRNGSHDMVERGFYMSNIFTDATMLDMGSLAPHGRFVHFYINGVYWGLFHLRERWGADMVSHYFGGQDTDYESINGNLNVGGWAEPGTPYDGTGETWETMKTLARSGPDVYTKLRPILDVQQYVDYMIMFMFGDSEDEYRISGPAVGPGHGFKFLLNDADGYLRTSAGNRTARSTPGRQSGDGPGSLFSMLLRDGGPEYKVLLADRIQRAFVRSGGALTPARNAARLTELCNTINKAMIPECARWNYRTPANWASQRDTILNSWFPSRTNTVLGYYRSAGLYPATEAPVYSLAPGVVNPGSNLTITSPTSGTTVYYTVNGPDPRLGTTDVAFNGPLITAATEVKYHVPTSPNDGISLASIPNLLGYWPLDANANDPVGGFNGALSSGATIVGPGKFGGGAVELNGSSQSVTLGDPAGLKIIGQITVATWVKLDSASGLRNIISKGYDAASTPNGEVSLRIIDGAYQGGYWAGASGSVYAAGPASGTNSAAADVGIWTHIAMVWDGASWRLYRNGVQIASATSAVGSVTVPGVGWALGARGTGTERFMDGQLDEVRIFNRGLTPAEVSALFNNVASVPTAIWTQPTANVSSWSSGAGGLGFAPVGDALATGVSHNVAGLQGVNAGLYARWNFNLSPTERTSTQLLQLKVRADDGYVVYLNGNRVAARNAPTTLLGDSAATAETPDALALAGDTIDLTSSIPLLVNGTNVLAVHGLNLSAADNDFLLSAELTSSRGTAGLSPAAQTYSGPLVLNQSTIIRSRAFTAATGTWSALQETFYQVGASACPPGALVVSELHYNPAGDDDAEFIEFQNISTGAINLRGLRFTRGVIFTFPTNRDVLLAPGERLVLVDSQFNFQEVQGWTARVGGQYEDSLDNNGGRLTIVAADGITTLVDFVYDDAAPWPVEADGGGASLVLIHPVSGLDLSDPANWRASATVHGNPNGSDSVVFSSTAGQDLDGDGYNAFLEYSLGTSDTVSAQGAAPTSLVPSPGIPGAYDFTFQHALAADDVTWQIEAATELPGWQSTTGTLVRSTVSNGIVTSTYRLFAPDGAKALFARVRFTQRQ